MHGTLDRSGKTGKTVYGRSALRLVAIPALLAVAMAVLAMTQPDVSRLVAEAVEAEFAPASLAPTQSAQTTKEIRTVKAN